jgi:hypothetical protein
MHHIVSRLRRRRPPHEVLAAWILTGPVGHLCAGLADWGAVLARYMRARGQLERM